MRYEVCRSEKCCVWSEGVVCRVREGTVESYGEGWVCES